MEPDERYSPSQVEYYGGTSRPVSYSMPVPDVTPFVEDFLREIGQSDFDISGYYASNAVFGHSIATAKRGSTLEGFKFGSRNVLFNATPELTREPEAINDRNKELFPDGFITSSHTIDSSFVANSFFVTKITGRVTINDDTLTFIRTLVIVGEGGKLLIANDHLFLTFTLNH